MELVENLEKGTRAGYGESWRSRPIVPHLVEFMQYISKILEVQGKPCDSSSALLVNEDAKVIIRDSETKRDKKCTIGELEHIPDVLGVYHEGHNPVWVLQCHNQKSIMLHRYIKFISHVSGGRAMLYRDDEGKPDKLGVSVTVDYSVELLGYQSNVVRSISVGFGPSMVFWTLYDYLIYLCRQTKLNIFEGGVMRLHLLKSQSVYVINFDQSQQAKRFFTQMLMEVGKDGSLH